MRDTRRDKNYFDGAINFTNDYIAEEVEYLKNTEALTPRAGMGVNAGLCHLVLERLQYCYSRGDAPENSRQDLLNLLQYRASQHHYADILPVEDVHSKVDAERLDFSLYRDYFIWLAFAVNLNFERDYFKKVLALMDNPGVDALFDRVAIKLGDIERSLAAKVLYPKPYALLFEALDAVPDRQGQLMGGVLGCVVPRLRKARLF